MNIRLTKAQQATLVRLCEVHPRHDFWIDAGTVCEDKRVYVMFTNVFDVPYSYTVYSDGREELGGKF